MNILKKVAISLASLSVIAAPVAASAAPALGAARAGSVVEGQSALEGNSSWIIGLIGLLAGITAAVLISNDDDDAPVSP